MSEVPLPAAIHDGDAWERIEAVEEDLGENHLVRIRTHRVLYGDHRLRECVAAATGVDRLWRSFFASKLTTRPRLSPGIADLVIRTIALPTAKDRFVADLEDRGFREVQERDTREIELQSGDSARLVEFRTAIPADGAGLVPAAAWLAVWDQDTYLLVAGGIYPLRPPAGAEECGGSEAAYREELLDLIRGVG